MDWDERSVRVVEVAFSRAGMRIRRAVHVPLERGVNARDPAMMGDFLSRMLREHRIRVKKAVVDVPRQDVILNLISLPRGTRDELAAMVHAQVAKELPFSKDQAAIDFAVVPGGDGPTCQVWVAAVRTHVLDYYRQTLEAAGLTPERIGLRSYALQAAVVEGGDVAGRTVLVDVGPSMTEISVIRDARLVYSRAASVAVMPEQPSAEEPRPVPGDFSIPLADDFLPKQGPLDALLIEISRTIQAYRASDPGARIDRIILSGSGGVDERLRAAFEARFASPTRIFEAPPSVDWKRRAEAPAAPFIAVIGLTFNYLAAETERFDFLHPKEPEAERKERAKRRPIAVLTAALFLAAGVVLAFQMLNLKQQEIDDIKRTRIAIERETKEYEPLLKKYADLVEWKRTNVVWLDKLKLLAENFVSNKDAYITDLQMRDSGEVVISLAAANSSVAPALVAQLRKAAASRPATDGSPAVELEFTTAEVGKYRENPKDPQYPFSDTVTIRVKEMNKPKATRPR